MPDNVPTGHQCVNITPGARNYLLIKGHGVDFPPVGSGGALTPRITVVKKLRDRNRDFDYTSSATVLTVSVAANRRLAIRFLAPPPPALVAVAGADPLTDGLLSITLTVDTNGVLTDLPLADVPVDYVDCEL
jgi:hypothetical protein